MKIGISAMPAKDYYHNTVIRALFKSGWEVTLEQAPLIFPERRLWIDMAIEKEGIESYVEVKGFENMPSPVEYLASAIGKYALYTASLAWAEIESPLYMAVPLHAYETIFAETIGQLVIQKESIKLIIFDPIREEIIEWKS